MRRRPMSHTCLNRQEPGQATLLLAHLREERLGSSLIASTSAFSPSMFPRKQIKLSAKLRQKREGGVNRRSEYVPEPYGAQSQLQHTTAHLRETSVLHCLIPSDRAVMPSAVKVPKPSLSTPQSLLLSKLQQGSDQQ